MVLNSCYKIERESGGKWVWDFHYISPRTTQAPTSKANLKYVTYPCWYILYSLVPSLEQKNKVNFKNVQVIQSWYVMGRLGAFNSTNLQVWLSLNPFSSTFICYVVRWGCEVGLCGWSHFSIPVYFSYNIYDIEEDDAYMFCICWYHYLQLISIFRTDLFWQVVIWPWILWNSKVKSLGSQC